jgi:hypothetical protein
MRPTLARHLMAVPMRRLFTNSRAAQAADLPVKAKPVQYVKICSLYGAGFYYIPGTDMCLKIGGWVRAEYAYGDNGSMTWGPFAGNANSRATNNSTFRSRGYITANARNQSEYGTIRSYIAVGINTNDLGLNTAANQFSANRAFVQLAGFTFGLSQSFFDFYSVPATALWGSYPASDTGDPGWFVMGYTAQFGGGFSATISAEERRMTQIINGQQAIGGGGLVGFGTLTPGNYLSAITAFPNTTAGVFPGAGAYGGFQMPDVVANLRADQAWGSAQVMGALHQVNASYYSINGTTAVPANGHPADAYGYALGAGIKLLVPMIAPGDYFQAQVNYAVGAVRYVFQTPNSNWGKVDGSQGQSFGILSDGVYGGVTAATNTAVNLTTAWGVNAAYEHFWNKQWKTSAYGGYAAVSYNTQANAMLCVLEGGANGNGLAGNLAVATAGCDNNWSTYWIGSRTQWNVTPDTYLAVDLLYAKQYSGTTANGLLAGTGLALTNALTVSDVDYWSARFRVHKDFYP